MKVKGNKMSIWKTPAQQPDPTKEILVEYTSAKGTPYYKVECGGINNMFHPKRWTYLSDLIAQVDKAERLQKAVDAAAEALKYARQRGLDNKATLFAVGSKADKALIEIKQLIKVE